MQVKHVLDMAFGDSGKGKITDYLAAQPSTRGIVRYHGGNNAGHTVQNELGTFPLHLVPCGIFNIHADVFMTNGMVLNLEVLVNELDMLRRVLPDFTHRLYISPRAHVIMPYHTVLDGLYEAAKGKKKTGTTGRGIGPCHADKVSYHGIRVGDLENEEGFEELLSVQLEMKNKIIVALGGHALDFRVVRETILRYYAHLRPYVKEPFPRIQHLLRSSPFGGDLLLEGAHGLFLDTDWGTYPYVTASSIVPGYANAGAGIPVRHITNVLGVVKAYTTRVGSGPFPTELNDGVGAELRERGHEFGTTTGRSRRCGWLDLELLRFGSALCGVDELAITKLDVLDGFETLKICVGYARHGAQVMYEDAITEDLFEVEPIYIELPGWSASTRGVMRWKDLPPEAQRYLFFIHGFTRIPIHYVSTGPARHEIITVK
ncbi:MAG: adenylosuccinate synthase [Patescibacteria group bacterium]|nr:adenylosuccinate synthase [Patescibacteria group bacterium]MDE2438618.1 adenylosuccinate synthase [Patescibacteria group bacterium]